MPTLKKKGAPGLWLKRSAERFKPVHIILKHTHALQIIDDHQMMWLQAFDDEERERVRVRCRKQLGLACVNTVGFEVAIYGVLDVMSNPAVGGAVLLLGAIIVYFTDKGL
jgi:hypothetical protein